MAGTDFTEKQITFLEKYCSINVFFQKKKAEERRDAKEQEFRTFNAAAIATRKAANNLVNARARDQLVAQVEVAQTILEGKGGKTDLNSALNKLAEIDDLIELSEMNSACEDRRLLLAARVKEASATAPGNRKKITETWDKANQWAAAGNKADLVAALLLFAEVEGLLEATAPASPGSSDPGGDEKARLARLKPLKDQLGKIETRCHAAFGKTWPPFLSSASDAAVQAIVAAGQTKGDDAESITRKVTHAEAMTLDFGSKADRILPELAAYQAGQKAAKSALTDIKAHKQAASVPYVAPEIAKLDMAIAQGVQKASAFDFVAARAAIKDLPDKCTALFKVADDVAELAAVRLVRETLVGTLSTASRTLVEVRLAIEAAEKLLTDGKAAADTGKLAEAVAKFAAIPDAVEKARILIRHGRDYTNSYDNLVIWLNHFESKTGDVATAVAGNLAILETKLAAANALSTTNIAAAITALTGLRNLRDGLNAKVTEIEKWFTDKLDFDTRLKAVEDRAGDEGRIAIEDFYNRLLADKTRAEALVAPGAAIREWAMASKIVTASAALQAAMIAVADEGKAYLATYKELDTAIKGLKSKDEGASASTLSGAETLLATAVGQKDAKDWKGANATLAVCKAQVEKIKTVKIAEDKVAAAKADPALATIAANFDAAYVAYGKAMQAATGEDTSGGFFLALRQAANLKATQARAAAEGTSPNPSQAETLLKSAIDDCARVVKLAGERAAFIAIETPVNADRITLTLQNTDNVIKAELDQAKTLMDTATSQNQSPGYAFGASVGLAMQVQALMAKAKRKVAAFTAMVTDRAAINTVVTLLGQDAYKAILAVELNRMKTLKQDITSLLAAGEAEKAKAKAAEGGKLAPLFTTLAADLLGAKDEQKRWLEAKIQELLNFASAAEIESYAKSNLADLRLMETRCTAAMTAKSFKEARSIATNAFWAVNAAKQLVTDGLAYEVIRKDSEAALKTVTDHRPIQNETIETQIAKLEARYTGALEQASFKNFTGAKKRLGSFVADCTAMDPTLLDHKAYRTAREDAGKALAELGTLNDKAAIEPAVARLRGQFGDAVTSGNQGDFKGAKSEFDSVVAGCATAKKTAEDHQAFGKVIEDAKTAPAGDEDALKKQIAAARLLVDDQQKDRLSIFVSTDLRAAQSHLDDAATLTSAADTCVPKIKLAMDACAQARLRMGLYAQLKGSEAKAKKGIADVLALPKAAFVRDALTALQGQLDKAMGAVRSDPDQRVAVQTEIEDIIKAQLRLKLAAESQVRHDALRDGILVELAKMDRHDQRYAMKDDIALARQMIATADTQAAKHEHVDAYERLQKAQELQEAALLKAEMTGEKVPDPAAIEKILARKDGSKQLDAIVATLADAAKKKVLRVAFEARFGCKLEVTRKVVDQAAIDLWKNQPANLLATPEQIAEITAKNTTHATVSDDEKKGPDIQRFYAAMTVLPDSDTLDNDSMVEFEATEGQGSGSFYGEAAKKRVTMREGEFGDSGIYGVGLEHELGEIEDDCKPVPSEPITFFNWNTLHEVGHAVDDKKGFMKARGTALAGWEEYGSNTLPIAEKVATQYTYDAAYISAYMRGEQEPAIPEPTGGATPEEWETRRILCRMWVDRARNTVSPWASDAAAKAVAIGGRVYQESYANVWTSYPLSERTKGVSGYQFRAPGEWFSELYAAYHTKKLNPKHPAGNWLKDL